MSYNNVGVKAPTKLVGLLATAQWLLLEAEYQSYDIITHSQSLLCFFIFVFQNKFQKSVEFERIICYNIK